jgi:hypothetical protein
MKKNLPLIIGIAMVGFMTYQMKNGSMAWTIIDFIFAVVNLAIWFARDKE